MAHAEQRGKRATSLGVHVSRRLRSSASPIDRIGRCSLAVSIRFVTPVRRRAIRPAMQGLTPLAGGRPTGRLEAAMPARRRWRRRRTRRRRCRAARTAAQAGGLMARSVAVGVTNKRAASQQRTPMAGAPSAGTEMRAARCGLAHETIQTDHQTPGSQALRLLGSTPSARVVQPKARHLRARQPGLLAALSGDRPRVSASPPATGRTSRPQADGVHVTMACCAVQPRHRPSESAMPDARAAVSAQPALGEAGSPCSGRPSGPEVKRTSADWLRPSCDGRS